MFKRLLILLSIVIAPFSVQATHNRGGEIHIEQIGPLTIRATIITWTRTLSVSADRDTLTICWGDGSCQQVGRVNGGGKGVALSNEVKYNIYIATHTYAGPARYRISMTDPNRNAGIVNVNPPQSENVPFHIETIYTFLDPQFGGNNTTPYLLQSPIDNACVGRPFRHNPNAYDPDLDSLSYRLSIPKQAIGVNVPNYSFPSEIGPGPNNILQLNEKTGDILWMSPQQAGEYNLTILIISWRNGVPIDTTTRDMQIFVSPCQNNPPLVQTINDLCAVAGQLITFSVRGTDPDSGNLVLLTASGGPMVQTYSPAQFNAPSTFTQPPVVGTFRWQTTCEHISNFPYTMVFKAVDSINNNTPQLAFLKTVNIRIVGPPPTDVQASAQAGEIEVTWSKPYFCEGAAENYFLGFSVWRREGSNPFVPDSCSTGLAGRGYTRIAFATRQERNGRYFFKDNRVERGRTYCYRIVALFARRSAGGYPYNIVESIPSNEACAQLPRDLPLIVQVSVARTDAQQGQIEVCWTKPVAGDLDTVANPGPYRYVLRRAPDLSGGTLQTIATFTADQFWQANDTCFTDSNLNTRDLAYHYRVDFFTAGNFDTPFGVTDEASSIFLRLASSDRVNVLTWQEDVPWTNYSYTVYRRNNATGQFDSLTTTTSPAYVDRGLENRVEYCYFVRSAGTYSIAGVREPLYNRSQIVCGVPIDTVPPCTPSLTVSNLCNGGSTAPPDPPYENLLQWNNPALSCPDAGDVVRYYLWYKPFENEPFTLLATFEGANNTNWIHSQMENLAGCYAISAEDSLGNQSRLSAPVCTDNCPAYELPNAFSPNGDGFNDKFRPLPGWRFIERVEMQIYNRWGNLIFETDNPAIEWDGRNRAGVDVPEGTYFYRCKLYERRVEGIVLRPQALIGFIELNRSGR
ncbi:MAG: gliding motility-associated C-terminal domain-containing protein [Saprospiraceae bacterium]|nr:gliding motility-associated C-terminal domain-containing protein [Saprospiraceae bacterium]MDW8482918.1 gliding motility-associated C-terminal domain-containing protein [Saprospiraceae bacterium]